jgi:hypothetical protein
MNAQFVVAPPLAPQLSLFEQNILRVLLYFNIFDHPLTAEEIYSFLPSNSTTPGKVANCLESGSLQQVVKSRKGYFFLGSAAESCIDARRHKEQLAKRRTKTALTVARFIRMFPFVRAVMLSGELSKGVASENSDIDFFIVTEKRRLWVCRSILILFKKIFLFNSKKFFCLNHFITEDYLSAELRNIYSATEIATLKPLSNHAQYIEYIRANEWIRDFFPNWNMAGNGQIEKQSRRTVVQRIFEPIFSGKPGDRLDVLLLDRWQKLWRRRYSNLSEEERNHKFRCDADISTAYGEDYQEKILTQYAHRLRHFGLGGLEQRN